MSAVGKHLVFEEYISSGSVEIPEATTPAHVLILRTGSPSVIEWRSEGRDHRVELAPGTVSVLPAGLRQAARVSRLLSGVSSILQVNPTFFERSIGEITKRDRIELIRQMDLNDPQIRRLMQTLRSDIAAGSPAGTLFGESIAIALSAHIAQQYSSLKQAPEPYRGGLSRSRLNRVLEYIDSNSDQNLQLSSLAEIAGLNVYHFAKAFKQSLGESPHQFVLRRRVERAKEYLRNSQISVIEASARTGFVDQSHFSKVFRRIVGVPPSEYRNNI